MLITSTTHDNKLFLSLYYIMVRFQQIRPHHNIIMIMIIIIYYSHSTFGLAISASFIANMDHSIKLNDYQLEWHKWHPDFHVFL